MVLKSKQKGITYGYCDVNTGQRVYPVPPEGNMTNLLPDQIPPQPRSPFQPTTDLGDASRVKLTCSPSLNQHTTIPHSQHSTTFVVCVESDLPAIQTGNELQVQIWHNHNGLHEWGELRLWRTQHYKDLLLVDRQSSNAKTSLWYEGELSGLPKHGHEVSFTIRFKFSNQDDWTWIKDTTGSADGTLLYQTQDLEKHSEHDIHKFFKGMTPSITVRKERADTDATLLYSLTAPAIPAMGKESAHCWHQLGIPQDVSRWFAEVRLWAPWIAPRHGRGKFELDKDAILLSFLRTDGSSVVVLAVSGIKDVLTVFQHDEAGNVQISARNDRGDVGEINVLVAVADSFDIANAAVFYHARKLVQNYNTSPLQQQITQHEIKPEWIEEWYDGFTYCTWNSLGQDLTADKIMDALKDLAKEDINVTTLIIDDNWQSLSGTQGETNQMERGWTDFEANKKGFPHGMKAFTREVRSRFPNIKHIAVWHAIVGYWGGVSPDGWIAKNYKTKEIAKDSGSFHVVAAEDVVRMYDDFYRFLRDSGVDGVKTDAQFLLDEIHNAPDRRALITEYQDAWTIAHLKHLGSRAISCMSQMPQLMFHSQLPTNKPRLLVRNSDDFFPDIDASHPWHIFCNAHNSIISEHLNVLPDWDMFQTSHKWASFHAAARCVSGGPIYFTDYPGHHNIKLIRQITAQTTRDTTIILRPDIVGKTINPYVEYTAQAMLKVGTYVGHAETGSGILGVFNVSQRELREFVHLSDIPGTEKGDYVVHSFVSSEVSQPFTRADKKSKLGLELKTTGWDILTAHALRSFKIKEVDTQVAMFGLLEKMTGAAATTGLQMYVESNGRLRIWASFKALGVVGLYVSTLAKKSISENFFILLHGKPISQECVKVNKHCKKLLEINVEKAWKESKETPGWSNEISIEIFIQ